MAWSSAALASYETARLALDKPLIAPQVVPVSLPAKMWVESGQVGAGSMGTWTDRVDSDNPVRRAYDGYPGFLTKPDSTAASTWYLALDLGALVEFDCAFLVNHNFGTLSLTTVELAVSDDNTFRTNLTTIADFGSPSDDTRLADLDLNSLRYRSQYVWLKLSKGSNFTPQLGELILGRRRQLEYKPDRPFDDYSMTDDYELSKTEGGLIHRVNHSRRGFELVADFVIDSSTYEDDQVAFFRDCRGAFVWIDNPNSAPAAFHYMIRDGDFSMPRMVANRRTARIVGNEQGPESYYLDVEAN